MFKGFIAGREAERCVLPDFRVGTDAIDGFLDGLDAAGWSSEAKVRVAAGVRRGGALARARMQAGREAGPVALRECTRTTCAARSASMSRFRMDLSSLRSWARTASRS
jgi:hypothetical protein